MNNQELLGITKIKLKDGKTYKLEFSFNTIVELEDRLGSIKAIFEQLKEPKLKNTRFLLWAGLLEHHNLDEKEVGRLLDFQVISDVTEAVTKAVDYAFPMTESQELDEIPSEMKAVLEEAKAKN